MSWPRPQPGLVIRYAYLWRREARVGRDEGAKDRPCAVVLTRHDEDGRIRVYVLPITHSMPAAVQNAIPIPAVVKDRLGLDGQRSWVVVDEANVFQWPGPDLRVPPGKGADRTTYGLLPPSFFRLVRDRFLEVARARKVGILKRTE